MASKNVIIKRKIASEIFELLPKTSGAQVEVTYGTTVQSLAATLSTVYNDLDSWNTFKKDVDFAGQDSALDTLRELIDMISKEDVATSIAGQLKAIKENIATIEQTAATLAQTVSDNKAAADATEAKAEQNKQDIAALTQTVGDNKTAADATEAKAEQNKKDIAALTQTVSDNKAAADATEAKATQNATDIATNAAAIAALEDISAGQARVLVTDTIPADLTDKDLLLQII